MGMVRQWQESFYGSRFSNSYMRNGMPDFVGVAKAYNIDGYYLEDFKNLKELILKNAKNISPLLIDVNVIEQENCYPMVAPGRSNSQMLGLEKSLDVVDLIALDNIEKSNDKK
jgi:acetolactate synthase-1/2/3 large subunit